jgi:ADP-ribose pyrophosphatase
MWEKQGEKVVFSGYRTLAQRTFATPDGVQEFEIKVEEDTAVVVALTAAREVVLVREFRPGPEEWLLELPGGHVDPGEDPAAAAARELYEETGFEATPRFVGVELDCAYSTRRRNVFVAEDARRVGESAEGLEVVLMAIDEFREHLRGGRLTDVGPGYRGLDELGLL